MHKVWMLTRAHWLSQTSYRLRTLLGVAGVVASTVPLYFVANALQPLMEESIRGEGRQYFGFVVVGMMATYLMHIAVRGLPTAIGSGIRLGTLEALLSTPTSLPSILGGMTGAGILWAWIRVMVLALAGWILGAPFAAAGWAPAIGILALTLFAYLPFGLIGAALVLVFRTAGPIPQAVAYLSILLGGVYYPTGVIPSWIQQVSGWVPLTHGLRALRRVLLEGEPMSAVGGDLTRLALSGAVFFAISAFLFVSAFRYSKRMGTLTQY